MVNFDYFYNPDAAKKAFNKNFFSNKKLGFQVIEHGTILPHNKIVSPGSNFWQKNPGGIINSEGKFIKESYVHYGVGGDYTPPQNQFSTVLKLSFILVFFIQYGDMS